MAALSSHPAHTAIVRGVRDSPFMQKQCRNRWFIIMKNVRQLYLDRKYKACAAACEEALKDDVDRVGFALI